MHVPVKTKSGETFFVEVDAGAQPRAPADPNLVHRGGSAMGGPDLEPTMFSKAVGVIQSVCQEVSDGLLHTEPRPSEVEMTVNIGFDVGGNVWIFKGSTSASLKLVLRWKLL